MAAIQDTSTGTNPAGSGAAGGGSTYPSATYNYGPDKPTASPVYSDTSLAEKVAANLAALGYTNSPLADSQQKPTVIVQPAKSNMTVIIIVLVAAGIAYWYFKKHGEL